MPQSSTWEYAQYHPMLKEFLIKNVNEGKRSKITGYRLKLIGMRAGLPDYHYPVPNKKYHGLWLEIKRKNQKNSKKNKLQEAWIAKLLKIGHYATYAYGCDDAIKIYTDYVNNKL